VIMTEGRHLCKLLTSANSHLGGFRRPGVALPREACATGSHRRRSQPRQQGGVRNEVTP
jgi:hypothetical protein